MNRLHAFDDDSVTIAIVPQNCGNCGERVDRVRMSLDVVISSNADFVGIQSVATTPCCDGRRNGHYPVKRLAELLDHLKHCPNHDVNQ